LATSALRRVIPAGYQVHQLYLEGVTPLLMSSGEVDRRSDTYVAYKTLSRKRGKTPADEDRLSELEFYTRLYYDEETGPYVPGLNIHELLRESATKIRKGADVTRSLIVPNYRIPLIYDGPRTPVDLWKAGRFAYVAMVANAGAGAGRVERTRPMFLPWALTTEIAFDPEDLSLDEVQFAVERAQKHGLGDRRTQMFGSFISSLAFVREQRADASANGAKSRDSVAERVLEARKKALMT
jgi:hypothetical protein